MSSLRTWMLLSTALVLGCPPAAPVEDDAGPRPDGGVAFDGGVPGPTPDAGPPGLSLAEACSTVVRTRCESLARCGALGGLTTRRCEDILTLSWCGGPSAAARAKAGFLRYDAARAQACVRGLQASTCEGLEAVPSECTRFILPARTLGESCRDGLDECREGVCRGESCPRQCLSPAVEGETCRLDSDCQRGLICRLTDVVGVGRCGRPGTTGDVCNPQLPCEKSMGCSAQGACQPWPAAGERCPDGVCNDAALCLEGTDGLLRCVAKGRLGAPCSRRDGCLEGLACVGQPGLCLPVQVDAPLDACSVDQRCPEGLACVGAAGGQLGSCQTLRRAGQLCVVSADCQWPYVCGMGGDGGATCGSLLPESPCETARDCTPFHGCAAGRCHPRPLLGEACAPGNECLEGLCRPAGDGGTTCQPRLVTGAACVSNAECASGQCAGHRCAASCAP